MVTDYEWVLDRACSQPGCERTVTWPCATREEARATAERDKEHPFFCARHRDPERVLRPDNTRRMQVLVAGRSSYNNDDRMVWLAGTQNAGGFESGPGFMAWADDFPEGTRLVVTASIELPDEEWMEHAWP